MIRLWPADQPLSVWAVPKSWLRVICRVEQRWCHRFREGVSSSQHVCIIQSGGGRGEFPERAERSRATERTAIKQWITPCKTLTNKILLGQKLNRGFLIPKKTIIFMQRILTWRLNHALWVKLHDDKAFLYCAFTHAIMLWFACLS